MGNPKRHPMHYQASHTGMQSRDTHSNKGKQYADKTGKEPIADHG